MIYLDNAATTFPKPESVYKVMDSTNRMLSVNAGRGSYKLARQASMLIDDTKQLIRELVHADKTTPVVLSPSITIAINQVLNGLDIKPNSCVYVSPYEHNAVARCLHEISKSKNITIREIPLLSDSLEIDIDTFKYEIIKYKPTVVVCTHISNVTGYILPVKEIFNEAKKHNCITVLDTAQSLGLIDVFADSLNADIITFAGHKSLYGPIGIGGYINVSDIPLDVFITGGTGSDSLNLDMPENYETKYEPASKNIVAIAGLNEALRVLNQEKIYSHEVELTQYLISSLKVIDRVHLLIPSTLEHHVGIVSFLVDGMDSNSVGTILDEDFNIAVRTGYHCAPFIHKYLNDEKNLGTIRIGLGQYTNISEIDQLVNAIKEIVYE